MTRKMKKPGSGGNHYPGQQRTFGKQAARAHHTRRAATSMFYRPSELPSPSSFYATQVQQFKEGRDGWASGCCPFHADENPSFVMNMESGGYKCLSASCGASGGTIISFIRTLHGVSAAEAFRILEDWR